jgi:hypothetical protein
MTVNEAIKQLEKLANSGCGDYELTALDDRKYSIVMPVKNFVECEYDNDEKMIYDYTNKKNSVFVKAQSLYE